MPQFVDFDWEKCIEVCLSGAYLRLEVCHPILQVLSLCDKWFQKKSQWQAKISTFCWFWLGTNALKLLECCTHVRFEAYSKSNTAGFESLCNKWFLKKNTISQKFHILLILTGKNALKLLEWCILRVWGMPNPMVLVASPYNKWFMKNHNFRRHIAANGVQIHENGMGHMQQSSLGHILPLHHVSELNILTFP